MDRSSARLKAEVATAETAAAECFRSGVKASAVWARDQMRGFRAPPSVKNHFEVDVDFINCSVLWRLVSCPEHFMEGEPYIFSISKTEIQHWFSEIEDWQYEIGKSKIVYSRTLVKRLEQSSNLQDLGKRRTYLKPEGMMYTTSSFSAPRWLLWISFVHKMLIKFQCFPFIPECRPQQSIGKLTSLFNVWTGRREMRTRFQLSVLQREWMGTKN